MVVRLLFSAREESELRSKIASWPVPLPREAEISRLFVKKIKGKKLVNSRTPVQPRGGPVCEQAGRGGLSVFRVCTAPDSPAVDQLHTYGLQKMSFFSFPVLAENLLCYG